MLVSPRRTIGLAAAIVLATSLTSQSPALADPVIPSTAQIGAARQAAAARAHQADAIEAELDGAQADLDRTRIAVGVAGQAYDAALLKLAAAKAALARAQAADRAARRDV